MNYDIEKIMKQVLRSKDTFDFKCNECGKCCRNREDILLTPYDIYRLAKHLELKPIEVFDKYCETYIGSMSKLPVVRLKPKIHGNVCPLLRNGKCSVHIAKPVVCALFPLGRFASDKEKDKIKYILQDNIRCGSKGTRHTVQEWLAEFDIAESEKSMRLWSDILSYAVKFMSKIDKMSDKLKQLVLNVFLNAIYLAYDIEQDFFTQFETNIKAFKKITTEI